MNDSAARASRVSWHKSDSAERWSSGASTAIATAISSLLAEGSRVRLLLSGGTTPAPIYRRLSEVDLDWSRVHIGLVDDRDVDPDVDGSNARLLHETILRGRAAVASVHLLRGKGQSLEDAVLVANAEWQLSASRSTPARMRTLAVLGMGEDGHTASLFPGARNLGNAFASSDPYIAIDATGCKVAGEFLHRISLTPRALVACDRRLLLLRGDDKHRVFETALAPGDVREMPIRVAIDAVNSALDVHWCA
jgi:6-phosphogluconolactonase